MDGRIFVQFDALERFYRVGAWELFDEYFGRNISPILAPILFNILKMSV